MGQMKQTGCTRTGLVHIIIMKETLEEAHVIDIMHYLTICLCLSCVSVVASKADIVSLLLIPSI